MTNKYREITTQTEQIQGDLIIIWKGTGKAYRAKNNELIRDKTYDYKFSVEQVRNSNTWNSIKNMHRVHPDYDNKSGPRDQTYFFNINFKKNNNDKIISKIISTFGNGIGTSDNEFRNQTITINLNLNFIEKIFYPYNTIRIKQKYLYEKGILQEDVELLMIKKSKEKLFMLIKEKALIYTQNKLDKAPTQFK